MDKRILKTTKLIKDGELRRFIDGFLERIPTKFWTVPSSSSGKYHPPEDNGKTGLVIHTLKAVQIGINLCNLYEVKQKNKDIVISAILLHDTFKNWTGFEWGKYTNYEHGKIGADRIRVEASNQYNFIYGEIISYKTYKKILKIARLVEIHMGRWTKPKAYYNKFRKRLEQIIIEADYLASRKGISFKVKEVIDEK